MREQVAGLLKDHDVSSNENFKLEVENRDLRDRIEMLENVIGAQTYDVNQDAWLDLLYPTVESSAKKN